jgi:hypothetical protein
MLVAPNDESPNIKLTASARYDLFGEAANYQKQPILMPATISHMDLQVF